jgi:hypothetical protein
VVLGCTQGALLCFLFEPVGLGQYSNHPGFLDSKIKNDINFQFLITILKDEIIDYCSFGPSVNSS